MRSAMRATSQLPGRGPTDVDVAPVPAGELTRVVRRQRSSPERADWIRKQSLNIKD